MGYDDNTFSSTVIAAQNPGTWANGIRIGVCDAKADQELLAVVGVFWVYLYNPQVGLFNYIINFFYDFGSFDMIECSLLGSSTTFVLAYGQLDSSTMVD